MHVPVAGATAKQKEGRAAARRSTAPGTLVSGTVLHVHADQATVQLSDGAASSLSPYKRMLMFVGACEGCAAQFHSSRKAPWPSCVCVVWRQACGVVRARIDSLLG